MLILPSFHMTNCKSLLQIMTVRCLLAALTTSSVRSLLTVRSTSRRSTAFYWTSSRFSGKSDDNKTGSERRARTPKKKGNQQKGFDINPNWKQDFDTTALSNAFDELAKREGFDESTALRPSSNYDTTGSTPADFVVIDSDDEDDVIDFGDEDDDMEVRMALARREKIYVPEELDNFSSTASTEALQKIGFRRELNPYGNDETPRKAVCAIVKNAMICTACGADFQQSDETKPGFLPPQKYDMQVKLSKIEQAQQLQAKMEANEWTAEDEILWLMSADKNRAELDNRDAPIDFTKMVQDLGFEDDLDQILKKKVICKRCHGLQNFGTVEDKLRPGWTEEPSISQEAFKRMLAPLATKKAVIIAIVDLFDFSGSVLPELDSIAGTNPVLLAANKADLFPSQMGQLRAENWVRRELEYLGIQCLANVGGAVRLISCKTGFGISSLLSKARDLAEEMECDSIYLIGAANAGKSTFINRITGDTASNIATDQSTSKNGGSQSEASQSSNTRIKKRAGNANARKGVVTTSPLPGTTLKFIRFDIGEGKSLYDTPGLLVPGSITQRLTSEELKLVVPRKEVEPITFRVASGKCVLIGGLAQVELIGDSKPFLITFFISNDVKLHPTDSSKAMEFIEKHAGQLLTPPLGPVDGRRIHEIGEFESHTIEIEGTGWKEAAADIAIRGLGWVSVTGAGLGTLKLTVPKGVGISVRPPLMPYDVWETTARFTGGRAVRKSGRSATGKRRSGVGRK